MRFFPESNVRGSVAAVMAASVFAAGVAALAVLVVVVAATNVGVIAEVAREQRVDRFIRIAADAAVDQRVHAVLGQETQGFLLPGSDREGAGSGEGGHHGRRLRELRRSEVS